MPAKVGEADHGCDDEGPVIAPDADPATPRTSESLVYGFLPAGATGVELVDDDGRRIAAEGVIEPDARFWAIPVDPGDNPQTVVYRDDGGAEIQRFRI